ncbi:MAG: glycosyltransferase [Candidatus Bathyarchaeota archaeon]|nr:glycosyltransferase [Candidatus Bathyarchaeota archaeon]
MTFQVTVGICVRNGEAMLTNAVESILDQTFTAEQVQIIFVDDGSQDQTPKIIQKYAQALGDRVKAIKTPKMGLGHARNLILKEANSKYVLFVDADEILTANYIQTQLAVLDENRDVAITAGIFKTVPGNLMLNLEVAPYIVNQKIYGKPKPLLLKNDKLIGTGGTCFRTEALQQVHGFDESIRGAGEDTDLILRILSAGWKIKPNTAELYEFHGGLSKPRDLLKKYYWYGYGSQKSYLQTRGAFSLAGMSPMAGFFSGLFYSFVAYRFLRQKQVFLLPLHFGLKLTAWTFGFMNGQLHAGKNEF